MSDKVKIFQQAVIFLLFLFCLLVSSQLAVAQEQRNILVLHSYHKGLAWTDDQNNEIMRVFREMAPEVNVHVEYMDWKFNPTLENLHLRYEQYKQRYAGQHIDLILTTDDAALKFALQYRQELFSNAAIVFDGVLQHAAEPILSGYKNLTGVYEAFDTAGTINLMQQLDPELAEVYLLYDNTESGIQAGELMKKTVNQVAPKLNVNSLNGMNLHDIMFSLSNLPRQNHSAVLVNTYSRDAEGITMEMERFVKLISTSSNAPLYILYDFDHGYGDVGGKVVRGGKQGETAAKIGLRILQGEDADTIPIMENAGFETVVDFSQLHKFGFFSEKIPPDAKVINKPLSFYEEYRQIVLVTTGIFLLLFVFIFFLVLSIRRRVKAEKRLSDAHDYLHKIINSVGDPIFVKDRMHNLILINEAFVSFTGYSREKIIGKNDYDFFPEEEAAVFFANDELVFESGQKNTNLEKITDAQGNVSYIETKKTRYISEQGEVMIVGVIRDITKIKKAEDILQMTNEMLESKIAQRTKELADANQELTAMNQEMIAMNEALQSANIYLETEVKERKQIEEKLNITVTTLQQTQKQLIQSGKMAALGSLVAGVAHEINTPLGNSVMAASYLENLQADYLPFLKESQMSGELGDYWDEQREGLQILQSNLQHAAELVRSFKNIANNQMINDKQLFNVRATMEDILLTLRSRLKKTKLQTNLTCAVELEWDSYPGILTQIISNLIINSVLHAYEEGEKGKITIKVGQSGDEMVIEYQDDGKGMDENVREKIFDPFFTTRRGRGGTGLGMYVVYNLVTQKLGGNIVCNSSPGKGVQFVIRAPL